MTASIITFEKELWVIENLLLEKEIQQSENYKEWYGYFVKIYGEENTNFHLYCKYSLIGLIAHLFIAQYLLNQDLNFNIKQFSSKIITSLCNNVKENYDFDISSELYYFLPFFKVLEDTEPKILDELVKITINSMNLLDISPEYIFDVIVQNLLSSYIRHKSGEFYTPPFIVKRMVKEAYNFGDKVLDPCCGSGNFLIEIIKTILSSSNTEKEKIQAIKNVYGYEINPVSVFLTKINLLYLLEKDFITINQNFRVTDFLFPDEENIKNNFDLIIGNPPWFTLRDIDSLNYQEKIKNLSEFLKIKPLPKNVLNIEIASLFFYKAKITHMKKNGKIFFVITQGVINGSHAARFRNFKGFKNIKLWRFTPKITKIFKIDFICIFAQKSTNIDQNSNLKIPLFLFSIKENGEKLNYFDSIDLILEKTETMVPYDVETKANKTYTNKLITKEEYNKLIPVETSKYKKLFHKGADLNPRNLIFVSFKEVDNSLAKINPDIRIFKKAKEPWNKKVFMNEIIEKEYLFKVIKSTELVKFYVYDYYYVFLPLRRENLIFDYLTLEKNAKKFYDKINKIYLDYKKESTKNNSLMDNLNRWSKLINDRQTSKIKVVYNNSGSNVNSAVVQGDFLMTGDLSFFSTNNISEAYYLSAILNSLLMTIQVQIKKSSRHIFKIPFEIPIKIFDKSNKNHLELADLAEEAHRISESITLEMFSKNSGKISKIKIQSVLNKNLAHILTQIDEILKNDLKF
ncbi:MAG: N-6 DNA methylase [Candidatus Lokiarchaeota archaeon]|nr:N-6 DNA methylase [Candidatus Lokiarchaeota archaeon]